MDKPSVNRSDTGNEAADRGATSPGRSDEPPADDQIILGRSDEPRPAERPGTTPGSVAAEGDRRDAETSKAFGTADTAAFSEPASAGTTGPADAAASSAARAGLAGRGGWPLRHRADAARPARIPGVRDPDTDRLSGEEHRPGHLEAPGPVLYASLADQPLRKSYTA
jgi:hypothetical protein